ncbi:PKD domain-containing protein [Microlunatus elymi]|uniref:PKD domain-containing protein n=1 Tax=Microlunatus elymi TaxID=2596828 RepID=A0A516PVF0_9ACTN|nr:PKD domain-containing protein [Microlunatus elymi]QDP95167.1 PKD domain-containing protein [Microlunatus elymi]
MSKSLRLRRVIAGSAAFFTALAGAIFFAGLTAPSAHAAVSPVVPRPANAVTADVLPTVQIDNNGIVWTQAIHGNTVYAGGSFSYARPAGAAAGTNQTSRPNLLAYDITTGQLNTGFNPAPNAVVKALTVSPDGSRLYVGGSFTTIGGQTRYRIAAFNTATGALISSFAPSLNSTVTAIAATNDTVYVGGWFSTANGNGRTRLAAFQASNGALLTWAPTANADITSMVMTPDGSKVVIGGAFQNISGVPNIGVAAVSASTGVPVSWPVNSVVQNGAAQAGTYSLSADNDTIYGTSYNFGDGNFEGEFAMNTDGSIKWLADCHGDTYSAFSVNNIVYGAGHQHFCSNIGGYPEFNPRIEKHIVAFTKDATGTVLPNGEGGAGYGNFAGQPSPSIIDYFPDFTTANVSGAHQAVWSLTGNSQYLAAGGEFPTAGGKAQQGLVRFAISSIAPNKVGVKDLGGTTNPTVSAIPGYGVRINWKLNWDPDDMALTYKVIRQDKGTGAPLQTVTYNSTWWTRPTVSFVDKTAQPGQSYNYRIIVSDPSGNGTQSDWVGATMAAGSISDYSKDVLNDGASNYWPLDDAGQSTLSDLAGGSSMTAQAGITSVTPGAINGTDNAAAFNGSANAGTQTAVSGPQTFSAETWIKTTTTQGGKILGFGGSPVGSTSSSYDRHIYMDNAGHITFGVYPGAVRTVTTSGTYNDGQWHHIVASLSSAGMELWVDGVRRGVDASTTSAQDYTGYWRLGGDNLGGWPNTGSSTNFSGQIDDTAIYPTALTATQIRDHYTEAGGTLNIPAQPSDAYGKAVYNDNPTLYWRLDDASGPTIADAGTNLQPGVASGGISYRSSSPVTANGTGVTFDGSSGTIASANQFTNPTTYSLELWFNTTTTHGGKLIGFGDKQSGTSSNYDRHVYMENSGQLTFGTYTGTTNTATSADSYNDGKWHYLVATQGSDGMKLYVDDQLVGTNSQTQAQSYAGYWRVGGDTVWSGDSNFFAGSIDEVAVYPTVLSQADVDDHYAASPAAVINKAPTAAFTSSCTERDCTFDGSGSADPDGSIAGYAWDFGDGSTSTDAKPSHSYSADGTYTVALTVTDNQGKTDVVKHDVTVKANQKPVAAFTPTTDGLKVSVDASASSDPDGTISSYAWDFGDGATDTGKTATHTYAAAGDYTVKLTVTDNDGATDSTTKTVTVAVPVNQKPTAAFTTTTDDLKVSVDGSGSSDPDGTISSYAWDFGDGATDTGKTASHTYAAAGDYTVKLTVTDNDGATDSATKTVTVTAPPTGPDVIAKDDFNRDTTRWGTADDGGAWTYPAGGGAFSTNGETGDVKLTAGTAAIATLNDVSAADFNFSIDMSADKVVAGGGANVGVIGRKIGNTYYSIKVRYLANGVVHLVAARTVSNSETIIQEINVPGVTYAAGDVLHLDASMTGASPTTLAATVWKDGTTKPANPQLSVTDSTAALQSPGAVGVACYLSSAASNGPVTVSLDDMVVTSTDGTQ